MGLIRNLRRRWISRKIRLKAEPEWVTVYQSTNEYSVRIHKMNLEDHGISVILFDQRDSSYNAFGYIYLHVRVHDKDKALELINASDE